MYRVGGESTKAIEQYTRALEDPAFAADANIGIDNVHGANGRTELALEYLQRALSLRPGDGEVYREIGYLQYDDGNINAAIEAYGQAPQLQPREGKAGKLGKCSGGERVWQCVKTSVGAESVNKKTTK